MNIKSWLLATRPKTLTAALVPIVAVTALVHFEGFAVKWWVSVLALLASFCIQIATNLFNDAIDFKKGADTQDRIGPQRMAQAGVFSYKKIMYVAAFFCFLALLLGIPLVLKGGWVIVGIGVVSLLMAYSYTGGPFPLAYLGLGDLFVILFFGLIAVGGVYFLQTETYSPSALVLGFQLGFLSTVLIVINNLRDIEQDKKVSKKTLPVRFGKTFARVEILSLYVATYFLGFYWWQQGSLMAMILPALSLPMTVSLLHGLFTVEPSVKYNKYLAQSALVQIVFTVLLSIGMLYE